MTLRQVIHRLVLPAAGALVLAGCGGGGLSGTYVSGEDGLFESLNFTSKSTVEAVFMGTTSELSYEREGDKVKISNNGQNAVFTIDKQGCLVGGEVLGTYCKKS